MVNMSAFTSRPWSPFLGMPIAGLLWSLASFHIHYAEISALNVEPIEAFLIVALGGTAQTLALWIGFTAVLWAMIRGFGGRLALGQLASIVSACSLPLWIGAPVLAYWMASAWTSAVFGILCVGFLAMFLQFISNSLALMLSWTWKRAMITTLSTFGFLISFISLTL